MRPREREKCRAAPDLDVVGVRAEHEDVTAISVQEQRKLKHCGTLEEFGLGNE